MLAHLSAALLAVSVTSVQPVVQPLPWNAAGHRIVALVTWDEMDPALRTKMVGLLKSHPKFQRDFERRMPRDVKTGSEDEKDRWIFLQASIWPDIARGYRGSDKRKYHRPRWHYINEPLFLPSASEEEVADTEKIAERRVNMRKSWDASMPEKDLNVMQALQLNLSRYKNAANDADKAVAICWLLHLVGDLHQPMHSAALFTSERFPSGDKGGNSIRVTGGNLHSIWDGAVGRGNAISTLIRKRNSLKRLYPNAIAEAKTEKASTQWLDESYDYAAEYAYSWAILNVVRDGEDEHGTDLPPVALGQDYFEEMKDIAGKRVLQAGARLAVMFKGL